MSKTVSELTQELAEQPQIGAHFNVHVLKVVISEDGEIEQGAQALPVTRVVLDEAEQECYLYFSDEDEQDQGADQNALSVANLKTHLNSDIQDYLLFAAQEKETEEAVLQLTTPLIGFGENEAENNFFVICQA